MTLHQAVEQYVTLKQSLGFRFHGETVILTAFSKDMGKVRLGRVRPKSVRAYLDGTGPITRHGHYQWETLRRFYCFAMARGWVRRSPLPAHAPKLDTVFTPWSGSLPRCVGPPVFSAPTAAASNPGYMI